MIIIQYTDARIQNLATMRIILVIIIEPGSLNLERPIVTLFGITTIM